MGGDGSANFNYEEPSAAKKLREKNRCDEMTQVDTTISARTEKGFPRNPLLFQLKG